MKKQDFNVIIAGVGGQGVITLLRIIAQAAAIEGHQVRASEIHGLSQRGGSVSAHLRFGRQIFSPLIAPGRADLILGLEITETLRNAIFVNEKTDVLINQKFISFFHGPKEKKILNDFKKLSGQHHFLEASQICLKELDREVLAGIYLFCWASFKGLIPIKPGSVLKAFKETLPSKHFQINQRVFNLVKGS